MTRTTLPTITGQQIAEAASRLIEINAALPKAAFTAASQSIREHKGFQEMLKMLELKTILALMASPDSGKSMLDDIESAILSAYFCGYMIGEAASSPAQYNPPQTSSLRSEPLESENPEDQIPHRYTITITSKSAYSLTRQLAERVVSVVNEFSGEFKTGGCVRIQKEVGHIR